MTPGSQLIIGNAGRGIGDFTIHLPRLYAENPACGWGMAGQAVLPARVIPRLRARTGGGLDRDVLFDGAAQQVRIAVVRPPFIRDAVDSALLIADQQTRFETARDIGVGIVNGQLKVFHKDRTVRERPFTRR